MSSRPPAAAALHLIFFFTLFIFFYLPFVYAFVFRSHQSPECDVILFDLVNEDQQHPDSGYGANTQVVLDFVEHDTRGMDNFIQYFFVVVAASLFFSVCMRQQQFNFNFHLITDDSLDGREFDYIDILLTANIYACFVCPRPEI